MKLKRDELTIKAILPTETADYQNAKNYYGDKETCSRYLVIDKKTERHIIACRVYMGRSSNASVVYSSIWINGNNYYVSGTGSAGGYGYHKESAAIASAISSAGIDLFGSAYLDRDSKPDFKRHADIGGVGDSAVMSAFKAIAYALGYRDIILVD